MYSNSDSFRKKGFNKTPNRFLAGMLIYIFLQPVINLQQVSKQLWCRH